MGTLKKRDADDVIVPLFDHYNIEFGGCDCFNWTLHKNCGHLNSAANDVLRLIDFSLVFSLTAIIFELMLDQQAKIVQMLAGVNFVLVYHMRLYLSFNAIINLK